MGFKSWVYSQCMSFSCSYSMKAYPRGFESFVDITIRIDFTLPYCSNSRFNLLSLNKLVS